MMKRLAGRKNGVVAAIRPLGYLLAAAAAALLAAMPGIAQEAAAPQTPGGAPTAAVGEAAAPAPGPMPMNYVVRSADRVLVTMWGEPGLTTETTVMPDGSISLPLLEPVVAAGRTVAELTLDVQKAYERYYKEPRVSLSVVPRNYPQVYVAGSVAKPGPVEYDPRLRLLDYVGMAGGALPGADLAHVVISSGERSDASSTTVSIESAGPGSQPLANPALKPWDTVWVGRALPVSVVGAVVQPGSFDYQRGLRLVDYVGMAGGPTNRATMHGVLLKHSGGAANTVKTMDLAAAMAGPSTDPAVNPVLLPGDVVTVPEVFIGGTLEWSDVLRGVTSWLIFHGR